MTNVLQTQFLPAAQANAQHLVLIHGWGMSSQVWQPCLKLLQRHYQLTLIDLPGYGLNRSVGAENIEALLGLLDATLPDDCSLLGFSLGGMLALPLAQRNPEKVKRVITVASNAVFVADARWPEAMGNEDYQAFYALAEKSPALLLKRFTALQLKGDVLERSSLKQLRALATNELEVTSEALLTSLDYLTALDNRQLLASLQQPVLAVLGERDQLVPISVAERLREYPVELKLMNGAAHMPFLSQPIAFMQLLDEFMGVADERRKKMAVAKSFSRAAASYDSVAELQRSVGSRLLALLSNEVTGRLLDLGCGTGFFLPQIQRQYGRVEIMAMDLAEGMLQYARSHRQGLHCHWLCGDAEAIPLADNSVDVIFSSLAIQWCENPEQLFTEIHRVLVPGGQFVFSTLGPNTLHELRSAWRAVDGYVHVNDFLDQASLDVAIQDAGLTIKQWREDNDCLHYSQLNELTRELKGLGAHNVNHGRPEGLMGKQKIKAFKAGYEAQRNHDGLLPASYQVWLAVLEKSE